jgi:hypothetical protein
MDSSDDDWFMINEESTIEATYVPLTHNTETAVQLLDQPQILIVAEENQEPNPEDKNTDWTNTEPVLIEFENTCTTPSPSISPPPNTERELLSVETDTETDGTGNNSTSSAAASAATAAATAATAAATAATAAAASQNKENDFYFQINRNALLVATLVTSSFTLGALAAFLAIQYQGRNRKTIQQIQSNKSNTHKFSGPSGRRKVGGNIATSSFILKRLEHLDPLDDNEDHVVVDLREEVKRLLLGSGDGSGRSRL